MKRIFIANQGEICRRIARSAVVEGYETACPVANHAKIPKYLDPWITVADTLSPFEPASFLDAQKMIQMALKLECHAIHPGFGFLSESAQFADQVEKAGLVWIGPPATAMQQMADKATARAVAQEAGVPITPGMSHIECVDQKSISAVKDFGRSFGYPILVKAAYGGGGKGMRPVFKEEEVESAIERAFSEASSSFGNGSLIVERYVAKARHIEVQVLADPDGQVVILGDRDCSLQRRNQKIIEEAPAPGLSEQLRSKIHAAAKGLAQNVGYVSAGTVEFILDVSALDRGEEVFFFLEMNTRIQVEHPVTEEVFRVDIVAEQLKVAFEKKLSNHCAQSIARGHAVEVRIYAEDPARNYLPAPGPVLGICQLDVPWLRWELGVDEWCEVSSRFDPMIAKVVAWGETRDQAICRIQYALRKSMVAVEVSNLHFLVELLRNEQFKSGEMTTQTIQSYQSQLVESCARERERLQEGLDSVVQLLRLRYKKFFMDALASSNDYSEQMSCLQQNAFSSDGAVVLGKKLEPIETDFCHVQLYNLGQDLAVKGQVSTGYFFALKLKNQEQLEIFVQCQSVSVFEKVSLLESSSVHQQSESASEDLNQALAPVPGKVVALKASKGESVKQGQCIAILESMKMEFEILAPRDAEILACAVSVGDLVGNGHLLFSFCT